jgi:hypothetical protein
METKLPFSADQIKGQINLCREELAELKRLLRAVQAAEKANQARQTRNSQQQGRGASYAN